MPRKHCYRQKSAPLWVMSYRDLMSLLLVFFIFVCSIGGIRFERSEESSLEDRGVAFANEGPSVPTASPAADFELPSDRVGSGAPLLVSVFFERGKDELPQDAKEELSRVAPALWSCRVPVVVAGYVSPLMDRTLGQDTGDADRRGFKRAMAVVRFLEGESANRTDALGDAPRFLPASGGFHGGPIAPHMAGLSDGRDRVDIYPIAKERG